MSDTYTPTTEEVRDAYANFFDGHRAIARRRAFKRWLDAYAAQVRAESQPEFTASEDIEDLPVGTILRDEIGRVFIRRDAQVYVWRTIHGPGFDLRADQAATYAPVRVLYLPASPVHDEGEKR